MIRKEVLETCRQAGGKDCGAALIRIVDNPMLPFSQRNKAVWALGQLADKRAIPVLEKYYLFEEGGKENLEEKLSQYELKKAIRWCREGNITSWMYGEARSKY